MGPKPPSCSLCLQASSSQICFCFYFFFAIWANLVVESFVKEVDFIKRDGF
ncbi:MAG: hypothetical protein UT59_C0040G0007 [candidate division CPR2 bacterium GW2011_GWD1_39_7]|nr:MAG: hypothetical protein UT59_C0040G0007 [candidate division CPR2 bacterium GW2011_GWD1_39_7]